MPSRPQQSASADADGPGDFVQIPDVDADPVASLGWVDITVDLLGRSWTIPAMPAAGWLKILWERPFDPDSIFPDLADAVAEVEEAILYGQLASDEPTRVACEILEEASGYRWWFTVQLAMAVRAAWPRVGGTLILAGVDPARISLGAWLSAAYACCLDLMDPKKVTQFVNQLNTPPAGFEVELDEERESAAFMAMMQSRI